MFCRNCGKQLPDHAKFCSGCGTPVQRPAVIPPEPTIPPVSEPVLPKEPEPVIPPVSEPVLPREPEPVILPVSEPVLPREPEPVIPPVSEPVLPKEPEPVIPPVSEPVLPKEPEPVIPPVSRPFDTAPMPDIYSTGAADPYAAPPQNSYAAPQDPYVAPPQNSYAAPQNPYAAPYTQAGYQGYAQPNPYTQPQGYSPYGQASGSHQGPPPFTPGQPAPQPEKKSHTALIIGIVAGVLLLAAVAVLLYFVLGGQKDENSGASSGGSLFGSSEESSLPPESSQDSAVIDPSFSQESLAPSSESSAVVPSSGSVYDPNAPTLFTSFLGFACDYSTTGVEMVEMLEEVGYTCTWVGSDKIEATVEDGRNLNGYEVREVDVYLGDDGCMLGCALFFYDFGEGSEDELVETIGEQFESMAVSYGKNLQKQNDDYGWYWMDDNGITKWFAQVIKETETEYGYLLCAIGEINWMDENL